jgi:hypothetical protein
MLSVGAAYARGSNAPQLQPVRDSRSHPGKKKKVNLDGPRSSAAPELARFRRWLVQEIAGTT